MNASVLPLTITPVAFLAGGGMIAVALGFIIYALVRRLGKSYLFLGMAAWVVTVALKMIWAVAANATIYQALQGIIPGFPAELIFSVYVGSLTGVFEVGITYLFLRRTKWGRAHWDQALSFGIGFGAIEAFLLGLSPLVMVIAAMTDPQSIPAALLPSLESMNNVFQSLAPVWERFFTVWIHIASNLLIFFAVVNQKPSRFWMAFGYKTVIDSLAAYVQVAGLVIVPSWGSLGNLWVVEGFIALWSLLGIFAVPRLKYVLPQAAVESPEINLEKGDIISD